MSLEEYIIPCLVRVGVLVYKRGMSVVLSNAYNYCVRVGGVSVLTFKLVA